MTDVRVGGLNRETLSAALPAKLRVAALARETLLGQLPTRCRSLLGWCARRY
jgi:hypothetical protein